MSLKQLNKNALIDLARKLSLDDDGTKVVLEERLYEYFDNHPELEENDHFSKFVQFRKRTSPKKSNPDSSAAQILKQSQQQPLSTPSKLFQIANRFRGVDSSPSKESHVEDVETDEENEEEEEDDDDDDDEDIEMLKDGASDPDRELLDADEEFDPDYSPSTFDAVAKVQDWFIQQYESTAGYTEDLIQDLTAEFHKQSNNLKQSLSSADSINLLAASVEVGLLSYEQIPVVQLRHASFLDQKILSRYSKIINPKWAVPDITAVFDFKLAFVFIAWALLSVVLPLIGAYYINFISKKSKKITFDPFAFNIVKLVLAYFFLSGNVFFEDVKNNAEVWASENGLLHNASVFQHLRAHAFHNSITLRLILGNLPFINGAIGVLVALYVAAI